MYLVLILLSIIVLAKVFNCERLNCKQLKFLKELLIQAKLHCIFYRSLTKYWGLPFGYLSVTEYQFEQLISP